jgi:trans-2,3-dihydro-3-hydroxyanthranilate isomerase
MGRESRLSVRAWRGAEGIRASVGGDCVGMFRGTIAL